LEKWNPVFIGKFAQSLDFLFYLQVTAFNKLAYKKRPKHFSKDTFHHYSFVKRPRVGTLIEWI
jgi:hypothetical protein